MNDSPCKQSASDLSQNLRHALNLWMTTGNPLDPESRCALAELHTRGQSVFHRGMPATQFQNAGCRVACLLALGEMDKHLHQEGETLFRSLMEAYQRTFLNYAPQCPNHWSDPEGLWLGNPDLPECGTSVLYAICAARRAGCASAEDRNRIACYYEFFAAVIPAFSYEDLFYAREGLQLAEALFPEQKAYRILLDAVQEKLVLFSRENGEMFIPSDSH